MVYRTDAMPQTRVKPAAGYLRNGMRRIAVEFDQETFDLVQTLALRDRVSFAEVVRQLVEWGLEA